MSIQFKVEQLSQATREKIAKELEIDSNANAKRGHPYIKKPKKYMYPYNLVGNNISIPMAWALKNIPNATRRSRQVFSKTSYSYKAESETCSENNQKRSQSTSQQTRHYRNRGLPGVWKDSNEPAHGPPNWNANSSSRKQDYSG